MTTIAVLGNRGGTGKTFIATHLAWALTGKGKKVFFIDTDYAQHSGMRWLISQHDKYDPKKAVIVNNNNLTAQLILVKERSPESLQQIPIYLSKKGYDFLVIDGRPEPAVTLAILDILKGPGENIIIFPCVGWDSVTQTGDVVAHINEEKLRVRMYGWLNQYEQARTSARIAEYFAKLTITPCGIALPNSVTVKASEMNSKPVWKIKGAGRTKFGVFFDTIATTLIMGRL